MESKAVELSEPLPVFQCEVHPGMYFWHCCGITSQDHITKQLAEDMLVLHKKAYNHE